LQNLPNINSVKYMLGFEEIVIAIASSFGNLDSMVEFESNVGNLTMYSAVKYSCKDLCENS